MWINNHAFEEDFEIMRKHTLAKTAAGFAAFVGLVLVFAACGEKAEAAKGAAPKIVNIGITNDPSTVNPVVVNNTVAREIVRLLYMPLTAVNENLGFTPKVAQSITTTDNKVFTVKIDQRIKWSDGKPVSADDVVFSFNAYTHPNTGTHEPSTFNLIVGTSEAGLRENAAELAGVKKLDDYTLTVEVKYPVTLDIFNLNLGSLWTMPKHILENEPVENLKKSPLLQNPKVTNGPFLFKEYVAASHLSLEANKDYYLGRPILEAINFKILGGAQITAQLESGEIDMNFPLVGNIPSDDYQRIRSVPHLRTSQGVPNNIQVLFINNKVINNLKVRQAMDLAIDREGILKNILKGEGYISKTPVTNRIQYWNEAAAKWTYDPDAARKLVDESGWDKSKKIVFALPAGNATREKVGTILVESFNAIGLNVVIEKADFATTLRKVQHCEYDLSIIGVPDVPFNIIRYVRVYVGTKYTWTNYSKPEGDKLVDTIMTSVDAAVLKDTYYKLQQLIADEVPVAGIYSELALRAVNKRVKYGELKEYGAFLDVEKWDVE
ncbi:MAG: ABC transporter substrate-binding protein [Spirochaetia bacterium]|nr:ABC transporter substrate-binding protein [Spirochaetia bacterium]